MVKKILLYSFAVMSLLVGIFLIGFAYLFLHHNYPFSFEKTNAIVVHKKSEVGLSFFPKYSMIVLDEADDISEQRVNKRTMISTHIGDQVSGYKNNESFFTGQQIIISSIHTLIFILAGIVLFLLGTLIFMKNTSLVHHIQKWVRSIRRYRGFLQWVKYILIVAVIVFMFGNQVLHFFQINFKQHDKTRATITEVEHKPGYGRFATSTYIFTLHYDASNHESIEAKIKVSKEMYDLYVEGNTLEVFYQEKNPYYVFLPNEIYPKLKDFIT